MKYTLKCLTAGFVFSLKKVSFHLLAMKLCQFVPFEFYYFYFLEGETLLKSVALELVS